MVIVAAQTNLAPGKPVFLAKPRQTSPPIAPFGPCSASIGVSGHPMTTSIFYILQIRPSNYALIHMAYLKVCVQKMQNIHMYK